MVKPISKFGLIFFFIFILFVGSWSIASTQRDNDGFYPETGHRVGEEFIEYYQQIPNPEQIYGFPITGPFQNADGVLVQYFQRARFEFHPEAPEELRIQLTPLGTLLYEPSDPFPLPTNPNACQTFLETGYRVCLSFLQFFENNGGIAQFGYPISNVEQRDNLFVQYFQRARLEWHPEGTSLDQEVQLTHLGKIYFDRYEDPLRSRPDSLPGVVNEILSIQAYAFPAKAVASLGDGLELYTIVRDQNLNPISGATVTITLKSPANKVITYSIGETNESGFVGGILDLNKEELIPGFIEIEATVSKLTLVEKTRTSFRISE